MRIKVGLCAYVTFRKTRSHGCAMYPVYPYLAKRDEGPIACGGGRWCLSSPTKLGSFGVAGSTKKFSYKECHNILC